MSVQGTSWKCNTGTALETEFSVCSLPESPPCVLCWHSLAILSSQVFDEEELLECILQLIQIDQEWVPYSTSASLYIRPTFIGTEVNLTLFGGRLLGFQKSFKSHAFMFCLYVSGCV